MYTKENIQKPDGTLGVLIPGIGAVSTTFMAGVFAARKKIAQPIGSVTQMGRIRIGKRTEANFPTVKDFVPLADMDNLVFGGWDIFPDNAYEAAQNADVIDSSLLDTVKDELSAIRPMEAVFDPAYVKNISGDHVKKTANKMEAAKLLMDDIQQFIKAKNCRTAVMIWCASTEKYLAISDIHTTIEKFEKALAENHKDISPSMIYAYAAIKSGISFINGAPNTTADIPALEELAKQNNVPIAGKDFKSGQTLMKTILAPGLKSRMLGIEGWFSTNILGNRDGLVLDNAESFKTKEVSKLSVLDSILEPELYPDLYENLYHKVRINYYPPRGDNKESWDNIDIVGWLNQPMQIKVNFLCKDSILAAPIVLDLVLFMDLAQRAGMTGIQEWLSFYFKSPQTAKGLTPMHDIFQQKIKLENTLRHMMGEELITHLGLDYYE